MKFGEKMNIEMLSKWRAHYMEYEGIKKLISEWSQDPEMKQESKLVISKRFMELLDHQLKRVNTFASSKLVEAQDLIVDSLARLCGRNNMLGNLKALNTQQECDFVESTLLEIESIVDDIARLLVGLESYVYLNQEGFRKIVKKFDKYMGQSMLLFFQARLSGEEFTKLPINRLLVPLSECYTLIRDRKALIQKIRDRISAGLDADQDDELEEKSEWKPPEDFQRDTTKYWVREIDLMRVKTLIIKHLPILIFGARKGISDILRKGDADALLMMSSRHETVAKSDSAAITSIYFDSSDMRQYHVRLKRHEGANLVRIRWYGQSGHVKGDPLVFIERKTHHESWAMDPSVKERFSIHWSQVDDYIRGNKLPDFSYYVETGEWTPEKKEKMDQLARETQELILEHGLVPMSRTAYKRTAFQLSSTNDVRISLDSSMVLANEFNETTQFPYEDGVSWCAALDSLDGMERQRHIEDGDVYRFPYGILEVKLQREAPEWIEELLRMGVLVPVYKFSKFLTSCAMFHHDRLHIYPHWFHESGEMGTIDEETFVAEELEEKDTHLLMDLFPEIPGQGPPSSSDSQDRRKTPQTQTQASNKPRYVPMKVEPKTFFANERTFISWMHQAVLVMTLSIAIYNLNDSGRYASYILFAVGVLFLFYALIIFQLRAKRIRERREAPYDDRIGPIFLVVVLLTAMVANVSIVEVNRRALIWTKTPKVTTNCAPIIGTPSNQFWNFGMPTGGVGYHSGLDQLIIPSSYELQMYFRNGTFGNSHTVQNFLIHGVTVDESINEVRVFSNNELEIAVVDLNSGNLTDVISFKHLLDKEESSIDITYDSTRQIFWMLKSSGAIVGFQIVNNEISATRLIPAHYYTLDSEDEVVNGTSLTYDLKDDVLFLLVDESNELRILHLKTQELSSLTLPGKLKGWKGFTRVSNASTDPQLMLMNYYAEPAVIVETKSSDENIAYISLQDPPRIWKMTFDMITGFQC